MEGKGKIQNSKFEFRREMDGMFFGIFLML
jgi:hypothetical protein